MWDKTSERGSGRLGVKVETSGQKIFYFRFYWEGKRSFILLGRFPEMSLAKARQLIHDYAGNLKESINPKTAREEQAIQAEIAQRQKELQGSIEQLINGYTTKMREDGKRTWKAVLYALEKEVYAIIPRSTKANEITSIHIKRILAGMIQRDAVVVSNRLRSYLMAAFNYGLKADNDPANHQQDVLFGLQMNPVSVIPKQSAAEKPGTHWLKLDQLLSLLGDFPKAPKVGRSVSQLLNLCVYTGGQRPYELVSSRWEAINWEEKTLLIVPEVSKNKRNHLIPLTDSAIDMLKQLQRENDQQSAFIFPQRVKPEQHLRTDSFAQAIIYYRKHFPDSPSFIGRDIRRTCKTLMGELGISKELRDRIQNHALQDVSSRHYDRYDYLAEKRDALEQWDRRLNGTEYTTSNVVSLFRRA
ncbi:tyrosine-type recombinase/integrase [Rosenbergiella australiborealis]|uniref:Tyrosine-type recombinase/integrase n=1 Tax=Rosenbergiella australiborealis TaxID=1544696 RepID=A0ABS5T4A2_9GAMM|nr:tyrosine-type recombinase/integrase [Rosenbergiella australiborealis]